MYTNDPSHSLRQPKESQSSASEVVIQRQAAEVILSARPGDWSAYFAPGPVASNEYMENVEDLPIQEREL
jgi:antitoxin VapB